MEDVLFCALGPQDVPGCLEVVKASFDLYVAPVYPPEGVENFYTYASAEAMVERLEKGAHLFGVFVGQVLVGILEFRAKDHVSLFFIHPDWQGMGLGRKLWTYALDELQKIYPPIHWMGVNSSPYAVPIYEKLGFVTKGPIQQKGGVIFQEMEWNR
jgi:GNAT superfamily N-acetyltransferase